MQQITTLWTALDTRRRVIVALATIAMFAAVLALARMASAPSMALLYAGLESGPAGEVVGALEQRGVAYEIRGGAIFVDAARRDELRMTLASEGLPANSARGYELLDGLSGFGTTSQMFDAAYWRAKEGELARTIVSHPGISSARVHIATTGSNPFQRDVKPSASVSIGTGSAGLSAQHAKALKYLVASAVPGLSPEDVSLIDSDGGLIGVAEQAPAGGVDDRAEVLRQRAQRLLEARVGAGNAVVEVSVDTVSRRESVRERVIDPQSRVVISSDTEEVSNDSSDRGGDGVTVASNLPDGDGAEGQSSTSRNSETRERVNYEISETEREITMVPGDVKRLTVAVLVNGVTRVDDAGNTAFEPRSPEELEALRELVASAVGFEEARGDVITIKTMQFEPPVPLGSTAEASLLSSLALDTMSLVNAVVPGLVALVLGLFVVRPILTRPLPQVPARLQGPAGAAPRREAEAPAMEALTGEIEDGDFDDSDLALVSRRDPAREDAGRDLPALGQNGQDPVERLRAMIGERQDETVEILRNWLEGQEEKA